MTDGGVAAPPGWRLAPAVAVIVLSITGCAAPTGPGGSTQADVGSSRVVVDADSGPSSGIVVSTESGSSFEIVVRTDSESAPYSILGRTEAEPGSSRSYGIVLCQPGQPGEPGQPGQPGHASPGHGSGVPGQPGEPGQPGQPGSCATR